MKIPGVTPGSEGLPKGGLDNLGTWSVKHPAVFSDTVIGGDGVARAALLRHHSHPLWAVVAKDAGIGALHTMANEYLSRVKRIAGISTPVLRALAGANDYDFGWLPVSWGAGVPEPGRHPFGSFWVSRGAGNAAAGRTLVLLGGYRLQGQRGAGGEVGLRVPIHFGPVENDPNSWLVRITGMNSAALPAGFGNVRPLGVQAARLRARLEALAQARNYAHWALDGLSYIDPTRNEALRVFLSCSRSSSDDSSSRNYSVIAEFADDAAPARVVAQRERISHATTPVFAQDPAWHSSNQLIESRRPTRKSETLADLRFSSQRVPPKLEESNTGATKLLEVRQTRLGQLVGDPDVVQEIVPGDLPVRSDDLAAAQAWLRGDELMRRFQAYDIAVEDYFKLARLPLVIRHRAPLKGAGDGISVNAQVRPDDVGAGVLVTPSQNPALEVSFGWAELAHRQRLPNKGLPNQAGDLREQPLGLAADPRWAWHEFSHVLIFARLGQLEFRFAHSAGDALAAIVCDPESSLERNDPRRGMTFPWVFIPRRHDRDARRGWCWCGRRNLTRLAYADVDPINPQLPPAATKPSLGYFEEQLLSTSMFRLYRAIGGDCASIYLRRSAADYCVFLLIEAIELLAPNGQVPSYTIGHLVDALVHADMSGGDWDIVATWPEAAQPRQVHRVRGCVHKVIRWAFEEQGLDATLLPHDTVEGPRGQPAVDLFIADGRARPGSYDPVPLDVPAAMPAWHATGIVLSAAGVEVTVGNLGSAPADAVSVECWALSTAAGNADNPTAWKNLDASPGQPPDSVAPRSSAIFSFQPRTGGVQLTGEHYVKASATCPADKSNLDPTMMLGLDSTATPLADLVANDNNLGLRVLQFP